MLRLIFFVIASNIALASFAETLAIVNAKAWTLVTDQPTSNTTIVVSDGKITAVTANGPVPSGAKVIDAQGRDVTPGLMHPASQLGLIEAGGAEETVDHTSKTPGPGATFDVQFAVNPNSALIQMARADGVTRAMSHPLGSATKPFNGSGLILHLTNNEDLVERTPVGMFATITNRSAYGSVGSRAALWQQLRTALDTAKTNFASKASPATRPPDTVVFEPILNGQSPLAITTNRESDIRQAIRLAREYNIRVVIMGGAEAWRVANELATAKIPVILDPMLNLPYSFDEIGARLDNAALLNKAGVPVAVSLGGVQSYNAGLSIREGAGLAVANGLPYIDGLRAIISTPAQIWGIADRHGTIEAGKDADLVIWDGDPLEPSTLVDTLIVQGQVMTVRTRQMQLRDRYLPTLQGTRE